MDACQQGRAICSRRNGGKNLERECEGSMCAERATVEDGLFRCSVGRSVMSSAQA